MYLKVFHSLHHLPPVGQEDVWVVADYISKLVTGVKNTREGEARRKHRVRKQELGREVRKQLPRQG